MSFETVQLKVRRNSGSTNPKKNPAMRRVRRPLPSIYYRDLPGPYKHPIRQKLIGLSHAPAKKTKGAFGGVTLRQRKARRDALRAGKKGGAK